MEEKLNELLEETTFWDWLIMGLSVSYFVSLLW